MPCRPVPPALRQLRVRGSACVVLVAAGAAGAQPPEPSGRPAGDAASAPTVRRAEGHGAISVALGRLGGGAAAGLEGAMRAAGYTTPFGGCGFLGCFPESPSPQSDAQGIPWLLTAAYRPPGRRVGVQVLLGGSTGGITQGRSPQGGVTVEHGGTFFAPQAWVGSRLVRVAAGPAFEWHQWQTNGNAGPVTQGTRSLGVVGGVSAIVPLGRTLGVEFTAQARAFRDAKLEWTGAPGPGGALPATAASVSHWYVGAGPAVRFD